jgi:hypothetical protein
VIDDGGERRLVPRAQEVVVARADLATRDVGGPLETEHLRLDVAQRELPEPVAVDAPRDVDEVEVRQRGEGRTPRHHETRSEQRHVERLAVVGDQHRRRGHPLGEPIEERTFLAELAKQELLDDERSGSAGRRSRFEPSDTDEERHRARASRKPRRLGVEIDRVGRVSADQGWVERKQREHLRRRISSHMHRRTSHPMRNREVLATNI